MKLDLCFVLIDLDEPLYRVAASEMIRSARRAYKDHDMRIVQLTDNRSEHHPDVDGVFSIDTDVKGRQFCQAKGHLMAEYALQADRPVIFCDVDLLWQDDRILHVDGNASVYLMWRDDMPCMPFNTGVVVSAKPLPAFWERYREACGNLPPEVCGWFGDQFAMVPPGYEFFGKGVDWLGMDGFVPAIDTLPSEPLKAPAVHFKGAGKPLMAAYARLLDKGAGFEFVRPNVTAEIDFGSAPAWKPDQPFAADSQTLYIREGFKF